MTDLIISGGPPALNERVRVLPTPEQVSVYNRTCGQSAMADSLSYLVYRPNGTFALRMGTGQPQPVPGPDGQPTRVLLTVVLNVAPYLTCLWWEKKYDRNAPPTPPTAVWARGDRPAKVPAWVLDTKTENNTFHYQMKQRLAVMLVQMGQDGRPVYDLNHFYAFDVPSSSVFEDRPVSDGYSFARYMQVLNGYQLWPCNVITAFKVGQVGTAVPTFSFIMAGRDPYVIESPEVQMEIYRRAFQDPGVLRCIDPANRDGRGAASQVPAKSGPEFEPESGFESGPESGPEETPARPAPVQPAAQAPAATPEPETVQVQAASVTPLPPAAGDAALSGVQESAREAVNKVRRGRKPKGYVVPEAAPAEGPGPEPVTRPEPEPEPVKVTAQVPTPAPALTLSSDVADVPETDAVTSSLTALIEQAEGAGA
jgi:hypothetical protein